MIALNQNKIPGKNFVSSRNACKLCTPLGASMVFRGVKNAVPFLHGSQGCSTYIRRYMISHFNEPIDIASSSFGESAAIFGGKANLIEGLKNVIEQYRPEIIGIATTCLVETIGDNVPMILNEFHKEFDDKIENMPKIVEVSTPSYSGTHIDGFYDAVRALISQLGEKGEAMKLTALMPGMVSPADLRHLKEIMGDFGLPCVMLPDYSETMDGGSWEDYQRIPDGGTPIEDIRNIGRAMAAIEFNATRSFEKTACGVISEKFSPACFVNGMPIGINASDDFFKVLETVSGISTPEKYTGERSRLVDSYVDGHKYVFGKRAVIYGEEDLVAGMAGFLAETGMIPVLCASGGKSGKFRKAVENAVKDNCREDIEVREGVDFSDIEEAVKEINPDLLIGNSKGYKMSRKLSIPLIRIGFPIHDRLGGARILHLGYRGTQQLFDTIANKLIEIKQDRSPVGYTYM
jgi:nitrogenase molybdenum-iron protein NifN